MGQQHRLRVWRLRTSTPLPDGTGADGAFTFPAVLGGHQVNGVAADDLHVYYNPFDVATYSGLEEMASFVLDFATNDYAHTVTTCSPPR